MFTWPAINVSLEKINSSFEGENENYVPLLFFSGFLFFLVSEFDFMVEGARV